MHAYSGLEKLCQPLICCHKTFSIMQQLIKSSYSIYTPFQHLSVFNIVRIVDFLLIRKVKEHFEVLGSKHS